MDADDEELEEAEKNKIMAEDAGFQQFLTKATKIVAIFIKNRDAPQELHRSVLQFMKISVNLLNDNTLKECTTLVAGVSRKD